MADYQDIRGFRVKYLSADPSNSAAGEVWYNSTTGTLRARLATEAWSSSAPLITPRHSMAGAGTQTVALGIGGNNSGFKNETEEYNGSGWATGGALTTARGYLGGAGTQTAALGYGGNYVKQYLEITYPERDFTFIEVDNFDGEGSGLGLTMNTCKD